jgi:4-hydroxy-tetrahydrodipicolinate synthase
MKKKIIFKGTATALVTPFKDGEIDYESLGALIDFQISNGIDALVVGGTTGEAATLSDSERRALYSYAKKKADGRVPLILGTGTNDTKMVIEYTRFAKSLGCDGALVVTPYYNKGTEDGIYRHYVSIADSTDLPIILYNVPTRTGVNLGLNLLAKLSEHPNIVALKEASDSVDRLVSLSALTDSLTLYSGNDSQIYPTLALGGAGVISVLSNLFPKESGDITRLYFEEKYGESLDLQKKLLPIIKAMFIETNPAPIKYAMSRFGLCSPELRLPLYEPRDSTKSEIDRLLSEN